MTTAVERTEQADVADSSAYRTFLKIDESADVIERVAEQFSSWLREKNWDPAIARSGSHTDADRELLVLHHHSSEGVAFRARLIEQSPQGQWRTQLTAFSPSRGSSWVAPSVSNSEGRYVAVPRIAAYLLDTLPVRDGESPLSSSARLVGAGDDVETVLESVCDPDRQGLFLVAATSALDIDFEVFRKRVDRWTLEVRGLAQVVVLTPDATETMREAFGPSHAVRPWTLRTFQPDADPAVEEDGLRHKFLSTQRLATDNQRAIAKLRGRVARRHASRRTAPEGFTRIDRALARLEDSATRCAECAPASHGARRSLRGSTRRGDRPDDHRACARKLEDRATDADPRSGGEHNGLGDRSDRSGEDRPGHRRSDRSQPQGDCGRRRTRT